MRVIGAQGQAAQTKAIEEIRQFLLKTKPSDFTNAQDFADATYQVTETAFRTHFQTAAASAIKNATKVSYSFFRLKDETPFGEAGSPVKLSFGAPDKRAIRFFDSVDKWYFSKFMRNDDAAKPLRKFLREEYLEKGAALFGRETPESLADFRQAAGEKLANLTDFQIKRIVAGSVARIRNWAHVGSMAQAGFELARYVAVLDARTTEICRHIDGKMIRVGTAQRRITELVKLEPGEFALEMYESSAAREYQKNPVAWIEKRTTGSIVDDDALKQNIGLPPLHILCRTRMEGVFEELEGEIEPTPAPEPEPEPEQPELSAAEARRELERVRYQWDQRRILKEAEVSAKLRRALSATGPRQDVLLNEVDRLSEELQQIEGGLLPELRKVLEVKKPVSFEVEYEASVGAKLKATVVDGVAQFQRFVSNPALKGRKLTVKQIAGRAYQSRESIVLDEGDDIGVTVHEIGHWFEKYSPDSLKRIIDFHGKRTAGEAEVKLKDLFPENNFGDDETTKRDNYFHPYMGKFYANYKGEVYATEQLSMGLEHFYTRPLEFARHDPEMFDLIYEIARAKK